MGNTNIEYVHSEQSSFYSAYFKDLLIMNKLIFHTWNWETNMSLATTPPREILAETLENDNTTLTPRKN